MQACLTEPQEPPESGVRIWTAQLDALSVAELDNLLDAAEQERAARFHFHRDRKRYIAARACLRHLLGAALNRPPSSLRFTYRAHGKPELEDSTSAERSLRFNLSHSAGWAMFALGWDRDVGIDLESMERLGSDEEHLSALAARVLSAREFDLWRRLPDTDARHAAFLRAWTRKEAYAKATGQGIFDGLRDIEVILDPAPQQTLTVTRQSPNSISRWSLYDLNAPEGFVASLAIAKASR